ncbi:bifunctional ADP-dependent NAD(P)H-hydrate dehydratase/NAD(P)H-hydrate epimerase [Cephaloticoccus primus]|nr:bifunctional ADP-dependent NAD(P)H-hydrate dehydratase/NAD(P)H-hydrate epimerase [Cephaloticoccus primus]
MKRIPRSGEAVAAVPPVSSSEANVSCTNRELATLLTGWAHPILSAAQAAEFERRLFAGDKKCEWAAMQAAGRAVAQAVWRDLTGLGPQVRQKPRLLVLAGKGHNGGDALIAAEAILAEQPTAHAEVFLVHGLRALRPLAWRAWATLQSRFPDRVRPISARDLSTRVNAQVRYTLCLDGVFGFRFRPPMDARAVAAVAAVNALPIDLRAAVDLPSGLRASATEGSRQSPPVDAAPHTDLPAAQVAGGDVAGPVFRADFTYATGSVKREVLGRREAGRLRYLDLGFFKRESFPPLPSGASLAGDCVLTEAVLAPLRAWRDPQTHKGREGHVFVLAGSREYPGAALMCVLAALRSGAGLVTGFVPESLVPSFAAQVPEAIWVGWPETERGGLALEGQYLLRERIERAVGSRSAGGASLVIGPGIGRERETQTLVTELVKAYGPVLPLLLDADALQSELIKNAKSPLILTPHAGEFRRIAGTEPTDAHLREFASRAGAIVVLKGPVTRICDGSAVGAAAEHCPSERHLSSFNQSLYSASMPVESGRPRSSRESPGSETVPVAGEVSALRGFTPPSDRTDFAHGEPVIIYSLFGDPVLARGGSGDLLAGMIGTQLAKRPEENCLQATCRALAWHGLTAETLSFSQNPETTHTVQLLNHLGDALRQNKTFFS